MAYKLEDINYRTVADPKAFIEESDAVFQAKIQKAAAMIAENSRKSPKVLLAGPSGSGKTTSSVNDPRLKSRACKNKKTSPLLTSLSAKNTTLKMS